MVCLLWCKVHRHKSLAALRALQEGARRALRVPEGGAGRAGELLQQLAASALRMSEKGGKMGVGPIWVNVSPKHVSCRQSPLTQVIQLTHPGKTFSMNCLETVTRARFFHVAKMSPERDHGLTICIYTLWSPLSDETQPQVEEY